MAYTVPPQPGLFTKDSPLIDLPKVWEHGTGMVKMTFTFDEETVGRLRRPDLA